MLLSIYASYRWAKSNHYRIKMVVFVVLASFLSAYLAWPSVVGVIFGGPCSVLSFPFYSIYWVGGGNPLLNFYDVHFLTWMIDIHPLFLFMLANSLGAALGYLISKAHVFPENYGSRGLLLLVALGAAIIGVGIWLYYLPAWSELQGRYIHPYDYDAWRFWAFGFTWIAVIAGDFIYMSTKKAIRE